MGNKRRSVRFDEHTWMLLKEVSEKMGVNMSVVIGKNYLKLRSLCCVEFDTFHGSLSREDIFQDTVLYVIQDVEASLLESEEDIIKHFCYRYKMIAFQIIQDSKQLREIPYADYLQTQKEGTEEQ